jgi:drug/metabolite transporter (DMT)-like permease
MNPLGVAFGIATALGWGSGDFAAGLAGRKARPMAVLVISQVVGLAVAIAALGIAGERVPGATPLLWAILAGTSGMVCLGALYQALATRPMGLISAIQTLIGVVVPVGIGVLTGDRLRGQDIAGIALAITAIVLVTRPSGEMRIDRAGLGLAVIAGLGAAGFFVGMGQSTGAGGGTWWPIVASRATTTLLAVTLTLAQRGTLETIRSISWLPAAVGVMDLAGNAFFLLAMSQGVLSLAVVVSSQYPAVTAILAAIVLAQRPSRTQAAGIGTALAGLALISVR